MVSEAGLSADESTWSHTPRPALTLFVMSSPSSDAPINLENPPSNKLTRDNYPIWHSLVLSRLRGAQLIGPLDGLDAAPKKILVTPADKMWQPHQRRIRPMPHGPLAISSSSTSWCHLMLRGNDQSPDLRRSGLIPRSMRPENQPGIQCWRCLHLKTQRIFWTARSTILNQNFSRCPILTSCILQSSTNRARRRINSMSIFHKIINRIIP
jgi:hypothetical protein